MSIPIPRDVAKYVRSVFSRCNNVVSRVFSNFPGYHEDALDMQFVSELGKHQKAVRFPSEWTVRIEAHFIGGGRHYGNFEAADIGIIIVFRRRGQVFRSKLAMLQSKKLYAKSLPFVENEDYIRRYGLGRLLQTDQEHLSLVEEREFTFENSSKYKALQKESDQYDVMNRFASRFGTKLYYLFYNPVVIPSKVRSLGNGPSVLRRNAVGCRVVPAPALNQVLDAKQKGYSPAYFDLADSMEDLLGNKLHRGGWRLEFFICDLMMTCQEGLIDDSRNFRALQHLMSQKTAPISGAVSITFDMPD